MQLTELAGQTSGKFLFSARTKGNSNMLSLARHRPFHVLLPALILVVIVSMYRSSRFLFHTRAKPSISALRRRLDRQAAEKDDGRIGVYAGCNLNELTRQEPYLANATSYFKLRPHVVNSFLPNVTIQARSLCPAQALYLLMVVPSMVGHAFQREAIRKTWASPLYGSEWPRQSLDHSVKLIFFLGVNNFITISTNLTEEAYLYGDIVQVDFQESYRNLSLKMAAVLHWSATYCRNVRHVLRADEDTFVHLPKLVQMLEVVSAYHSYYVLGSGAKFAAFGWKMLNASRWKLDPEIYPFRSYPVYLYSHSYVISGNAVSDLLYAYRHMPFVEMEDVFFTGILRKTLGMKILRCWQFACPDTEHTNRRNLVYGKAFSQTGFTNPEQMYALWDWIMKSNPDEAIL